MSVFCSQGCTKRCYLSLYPLIIIACGILLIAHFYQLSFHILHGDDTLGNIRNELCVDINSYVLLLFFDRLLTMK